MAGKVDTTEEALEGDNELAIALLGKWDDPNELEEERPCELNEALPTLDE